MLAIYLSPGPGGQQHYFQITVIIGNKDDPLPLPGQSQLLESSGPARFAVSTSLGRAVSRVSVQPVHLARVGVDDEHGVHANQVDTCTRISLKRLGAVIVEPIRMISRLR